MAQRTVRLFLLLAAPLVPCAVLLPACWNSDSLGPLFGAPNDGSGDGGFDPGTGGGVGLKDLFVNARILRELPTVPKAAPADASTDVPLKSPLAVEFSESMFATSVRTGINLFAEGSTSATAVSVTLFQGDSVAVMIPVSDLLPNQRYEIAVPGNLVDLQGSSLEIGENQIDLRFGFTTAAATADPDFQVVYTSPAQRVGNVPRGSEAVLLFSEPINTSISGGGINAPGNFSVTRNGTTLTLGIDYVFSTFPSANPRGVQVAFTTLAPANSVVEVIIGAAVENADGRKTLLGGNGFTLEFTAQDGAIPTDIDFPGSVSVSDADGAVSSSTIHAFPADVFLTSDGVTPDTTTLIYLDVAQENSLVFTEAGANPTPFVSDLEPESTPALNEGEILVGSYVERRGFRSEVSVVKELVKDTVGPRLLSIGPPNLGSGVLLTQVNDPVIHGQMSEACTGVQIDFDGAGAPDFNSIQFAAGTSTVTDEFFFTGKSEDAALPQQLEGDTSFSFICSDQFGNVAVNLDQVIHVTVGKVGGTIASPDGASALYVAAYAADDFQLFVNSAAVILDQFPPDPTGANQIVKGVTSSFGVVRFTELELASILTAQVTVTIVAKRSGGFGQPQIVYGPISFAGLDKPTAASPRAVLALLHPDSTVETREDARCDIQNESAATPTETGSAFTADLVETTPELERTADLKVDPSFTENIVRLPKNQLETFTVVEEFGGSDFRFSSSEPFLAEDVSGGGTSGNALTRSVDFLGQNTGYSAALNPELVHLVSFSDSLVSNAGGLPGPLGFVGSEADQYRELRLVGRLPGFVDNVGLFAESAFTPNGDTRTAAALLPLPLIQNNAGSGGVGFEDTGFELLMQPNLLDPAIAVDPALLRRNLRVELIVQDKVNTATTAPSSAWVRERLLLTPTAPTNQAAVLQAIPTPTVVSSVHPPQFSWPEVTQGEGMHVLHFVFKISQLTWKIFVPAQAGGGTLTMQVPALPTDLPDGVGFTDFALPGSYQAYVESYDFDPDHLFDATSLEQYHFDPQSYFQSDLEREFLRASRSDPNFAVTTQ